MSRWASPLWRNRVMDKKKSLDIATITYGECPPELTITFNQTIRSIDLHKIALLDVKVPNIITGLKITAIQAS